MVWYDAEDQNPLPMHLEQLKPSIISLKDSPIAVFHLFEAEDIAHWMNFATELIYEDAKCSVSQEGLSRTHLVRLNKTSPLIALAEQLRQAISSAAPDAFQTSLHFNHINVQRFSEKMKAIKWRRESPHFTNLVVHIVIKGTGNVLVPSKPRVVRSGDCIMIALPGMYGTERRIWHGAKDIAEESYVLSFRQDRNLQDGIHKVKYHQ
jgi:hypothetical protein